MRIAVWHDLPSGGGKRALVDQVRTLVELGHHVEAWCPVTATETFLPLSAVVQEHRVDLRSPTENKRLAVGEFLGDYSARVRAMDAHTRECARQIVAGRFDVLFANSCMKFRVTAIGRLTPLPSVLYLQEPYRWLYEAMPTPPWAADDREVGWWRHPRSIAHAIRRGVAVRRQAVLVREEVRNAAAFNVIACNSQFSRESILRAYGIDAKVCYLGVDVASFSPPRGDRQASPFFLTVGAGVSEKNVDFIVRALGLRRDKSIPLVWVANTYNAEYVTSVRCLAERLGVIVSSATTWKRPNFGGCTAVRLYFCMRRDLSPSVWHHWKQRRAVSLRSL